MVRLNSQNNCLALNSTAEGNRIETRASTDICFTFRIFCVLLRSKEAPFIFFLAQSRRIQSNFASLWSGPSSVANPDTPLLSHLHTRKNHSGVSYKTLILLWSVATERESESLKIWLYFCRPFVQCVSIHYFNSSSSILMASILSLCLTLSQLSPFLTQTIYYSYADSTGTYKMSAEHLINVLEKTLKGRYYKHLIWLETSHMRIADKQKIDVFQMYVCYQSD